MELTGIVAHRPYPLPDAPWIMQQTWVDLLFAHWRAPASELRRRIPAELELEEFDGSAWLGIAPFEVVGLHPRLLPPLPLASRFPELNVRTYVRYGGKPGVFFFSLDAGSTLAVKTARAFFRLPYFRASMHIRREGEWLRFRSRRVQRGGAAFTARYRPLGPGFEARPGTLEHFLIERYCLYTGLLGPRIFRVDIHHAPWPLQRAEAVIDENGMAEASGLRLPDEPPILHFARRQPTLVWAPELVARRDGAGDAAR